MKKKIAIYIVIMLVVSLSAVGLFAGESHARAAQLFLQMPDSVKKEDTFQVHVILDSDVDLYSLEAYLKYDETMLEFLPEDDVVTGSAGVLEINDVYPEEIKKKEYVITFKALETGNTEIAFSEVYLIDYANMDYMEVMPTSDMVEVKLNQSEDDDIRLASILVAPGELQEAFRSDCYEYEMHVPLDVEMIGISAVPLEESSVIESDIPEKLKEGENLITIKVTALSGKVGIYKIHVYREEIKEEENSETEDASEDMISSEEDSQVENSSEEQTTEVASEEMVTEESTTEEVTATEKQEENMIEKKVDSASEEGNQPDNNFILQE